MMQWSGVSRFIICQQDIHIYVVYYDFILYYMLYTTIGSFCYSVITHLLASRAPSLPTLTSRPIWDTVFPDRRCTCTSTD